MVITCYFMLRDPVRLAYRSKIFRSAYLVKIFLQLDFPLRLFSCFSAQRLFQLQYKHLGYQIYLASKLLGHEKEEEISFQ